MIVCEESFVGFLCLCGFDYYIKFGKGEEKFGGCNCDIILGDLFEVFLGVLLLDKGVEVVYVFVNKVMIFYVEKGIYECVKDYKISL